MIAIHSAWRRCLVGLLCLFALGPSGVFGGGFLLVDQAGPYRWDPNRPVKYRVDRGGLNSLLEEQQSVEFVASIFSTWEDVPSASVTFQSDGLLDEDVTAENARQFLRRTADGLTPIVLDRDGSIIELLLGAGSSRSILGFASPTVIDRESHTISEAHAVINGSLRVGQSILRIVMLHEFGHLQGLDHTQAGIEFTGLQGDNFMANGRSYIPVMFPIIFNGAPEQLQDDDVLWISNLYPADLRETGSVSGFVKRASGDFFPGANVVLRSVDYDPPRGLVRIYSVVSDYLLRGNGEFQFEGVKPGSYQLFIEPLFAGFTEGSGVGPFDSRFANFPRDFYNGVGESGDPDSDDPLERVILNVRPDVRIENIALASNEIPNNLTALVDDDAVGYVFPNGFRFPFYGKVYDRVFVNSDGNLTFAQGEFSSTERDLKRFVSGPPRIGALFSDLNPEQGGEVLFAQRDNSVSFTWMNVPEFSGRPRTTAEDRNQFSITLFANGDVEFRYGDLKVTRGEEEELAAVVGITPGSGAVAREADLSQSDSYTYGNTTGIVEVFADSVDLASREILFRSGGGVTLPPRKTLLFPLLQGGSDFFTALAVSNSGNASARLSFTAYAVDGRQVYAVDQSIGPNSQLARLITDLIRIPGGGDLTGWVQLKADTDTIAGLYQVGNFNALWLDGGTAFSEIGTHLFLTRVSEGAGTFQGRDAETWISVANPNDVIVRLVLSLHSASGTRRSRREIKLAPHALVFDRVSNLFNDVSFPQADGYVSVLGIGGGVAAFELVRAGDTAIGQAAVTATFAKKFYSALLAHGSLAGGSLFTGLNIVNTSDAPITVQGRAFNQRHETIGIAFSRQLRGFESVQMSAEDLFGLGNPRIAPLSAGSIELSAEAAGIVADVLFGDASAEVRFAADLPLQSDLATEAHFSHLASGRLRASDAASGHFTGIALYNPNSVSAALTLEVYTLQGEIKRSRPILLQPGQRTSQFLTELVPSLGTQFGGYIVVKSDVGIVAQEFFGNELLDFLSALPPDATRKSDLK